MSGVADGGVAAGADVQPQASMHEPRSSQRDLMMPGDPPPVTSALPAPSAAAILPSEASDQAAPLVPSQIKQSPALPDDSIVDQSTSVQGSEPERASATATTSAKPPGEPPVFTGVKRVRLLLPGHRVSGVKTEENSVTPSATPATTVPADTASPAVPAASAGTAATAAAASAPTTVPAAAPATVGITSGVSAGTAGTAPPSKPRAPPRPRPAPAGGCGRCSRLDSPLWRKGPGNVHLCNACGLQYTKRLSKGQTPEEIQQWMSQPDMPRMRSTSSRSRKRKRDSSDPNAAVPAVRRPVGSLRAASAGVARVVASLQDGLDDDDAAVYLLPPGVAQNISPSSLVNPPDLHHDRRSFASDRWRPSDALSDSSVSTDTESEGGGRYSLSSASAAHEAAVDVASRQKNAVTQAMRLLADPDSSADDMPATAAVVGMPPSKKRVRTSSAAAVGGGAGTSNGLGLGNSIRSVNSSSSQVHGMPPLGARSGDATTGQIVKYCDELAGAATRGLDPHVLVAMGRVLLSHLLKLAAEARPLPSNLAVSRPKKKKKATTPASASFIPAAATTATATAPASSNTPPPVAATAAATASTSAPSASAKPAVVATEPASATATSLLEASSVQELQLSPETSEDEQDTAPEVGSKIDLGTKIAQIIADPHAPVVPPVSSQPIATPRSESPARAAAPPPSDTASI